MTTHELSPELFVDDRQEQLLNNPSEVSCFLACLALVNQLRSLQCAFEGGRIAQRDFVDQARILIERLSQKVAATEQFDIVMPVMGDGQFSPYFWRWFNWWEDYLQGLITKTAEIVKLRRKLRSAVNRDRPSHQWFGCRDKPAFTLPQAR